MTSSIHQHQSFITTENTRHSGQDIFNTAAQVSRHKPGHVDVIILKIEKSFDLLKPDRRCVFDGDRDVLIDLFRTNTSHIKIHHEDDEMLNNSDRSSEKTFSAVEIPTMSLIEGLTIAHKHILES